MINSRFFYLYLAGGLIALILLVINIVSSYPQVQNASTFIEILLAILFFYLANKTYHEKRDKDLM